jgi:hypothetical protein
LSLRRAKTACPKSTPANSRELKERWIYEEKRRWPRSWFDVRQTAAFSLSATSHMDFPNDFSDPRLAEPIVQFIVR